MSRRTVFNSSQRFEIQEPTVNLTPLIDVVFVILIAFIVLAPLLELDEVELADARDASKDRTLSVQEASPIAIYVRQDNSIVVNGQLVKLSQLTDQLKLLKKQYPKARPQVFHDKKAHFGTYQSVKNALEAVGFQQMDIILNPA